MWLIGAERDLMAQKDHFAALRSFAGGRMKIAMVSPYDFAIYGGVQTHVVELSNALIEQGHDVRVLAPCTGNESVYDLRTAPLETFGRTVPFVTAGSVARISMSVWYQRKLMSILEGQNFDVVHIHEPLMPMFGLMASYYSPSPTVGTFHAYNEGPGRGYMFWKPVLKLNQNTTPAAHSSRAPKLPVRARPMGTLCRKVCVVYGQIDGGTE